MKFFSIITFALPVLSMALPASQDTTDPIPAFIDAANQTMIQVKLFGCKVKPCLEALAPSLVICAAAAAQEELDPINDAACFAAAAKDVAHKPAACDHCY